MSSVEETIRIIQEMGLGSKLAGGGTGRVKRSYTEEQLKEINRKKKLKEEKRKQTKQRRKQCRK